MTLFEFRLLPTGRMQLIVEIDRPELPATMFGVESVASTLTSSRACVGVLFRPGGAYPFLRMSAAELLDTSVSLDVIWGNEAHRLRERLDRAAAPSDKLRVLEQVLLGFAGTREPSAVINGALAQFARHPGAVRVGNVVRRVAVRPKRFISMFRDEVGVTPKLYCRIRRFQRVLREVRAARPARWSDIAVRYEYADQAHLVREFRQLSGVTPSAFTRMWRSHRAAIHAAEPEKIFKTPAPRSAQCRHDVEPCEPHGKRRGWSARLPRTLFRPAGQHGSLHGRGPARSRERGAGHPV